MRKAPSPPAAPVTPPKAKSPGARSPEGTVAFTGLGAPKIQASFSELKQDGSTGRTISVSKEIFVGRGNCDASYPSDPLLSPRHASVAVRQGKLFLRDWDSQNGTFIKLREDTELRPGEVFLLGRELFRFTTQSLEESKAQSAQETMVISGAPKLRGPVTARLEHIQLTGEVIEEFSLDKPETSLGRTAADLVFKNDPYMSATHARIVAQPGRFILQDLKSTNGIYRRIRGEAELRDGDEFFLGEQRFRVTAKTL
jgi:pSer/pThr/pTyr-binding forkhead associated (FHA) protein